MRKILPLALVLCLPSLALADLSLGVDSLHSRCVRIGISGPPYQLQTVWTNGAGCTKPDAYTGDITSHCINQFEMSTHWHQIPGCSCFTHIQANTPVTVNNACTTFTSARYDVHEDCGQ